MSLWLFRLTSGFYRKIFDFWSLQNITIAPLFFAIALLMCIRKGEHFNRWCRSSTSTGNWQTTGCRCQCCCTFMDKIGACYGAGYRSVKWPAPQYIYNLKFCLVLFPPPPPFLTKWRSYPLSGERHYLPAGTIGKNLDCSAHAPSPLLPYPLCRTLIWPSLPADSRCLSSVTRHCLSSVAASPTCQMVYMVTV